MHAGTGSIFSVRGLLLPLLILSSCDLCPSAVAQEEHIITLSNGMILGPGVPSETDSISTNAFQRGGNGEVGLKSIGILDDGLRLTFFNQSRKNIASIEPSNAPAHEQIEFPSAAEAARSGNPPSIVGILGQSEFNKYGRRTFSFMTTRGRVDVLQGITLLTPTFAKVEILRTKTEKFAWDSRIATASIPADKLREILYQSADLSRANEWLRLVSFYMQARRFNEAQEIMTEALRRFPTELADRRPLLVSLSQLLADQKFGEISLRRGAGQQELATRLLGGFPVEALPLETQAKLDVEVKKIQSDLLTVGQLTESLQEHVAQLPEPDQQVVAEIVEEIMNEISLETIDRLADFNRLRNDNSLPNENKVAFALSGWMLGSGIGLDNFAVVKSLLRVRRLTAEYLNDCPAPRRKQILNELRGEEGAQPALLDALLEYMKPPMPLPPLREKDPAGLVRLSVTTSSGETVPYVVQVPPEYDPNRKYPCVLALPGRGDPAEMEINWWCGPEMPLPSGGNFRFGQGTRYGYIVVSPEWMLPKQADYQYTEKEKTRILKAFRDALRHFSIDTDRVFVSGHYDGATAAWDLAVSHPDLWAGAVMISPGADKYIVQYSENIKRPDQIGNMLGTYLVYGDSDGTRYTSNMGRAATRYLTTPTYDSIVVEYRGRGRETFVAELPRIVEWMSLSSHVRERKPQTINTTTMRGGDNRFYWLEAPTLLPAVAGNPYQFDPSASGTFDARILEPAVNGVSISKIPSSKKSARVWLTPDMVDFSRTITVALAGRRQRFDSAPDIEVMLEDVRGRGDRQHVYWQVLDLK